MQRNWLVSSLHLLTGAAIAFSGFSLPATAQSPDPNPFSQNSLCRQTINTLTPVLNPVDNTRWWAIPPLGVVRLVNPQNRKTIPPTNGAEYIAVDLPYPGWVPTANLTLCSPPPDIRYSLFVKNKSTCRRLTATYARLFVYRKPAVIDFPSDIAGETLYNKPFYIYPDQNGDSIIFQDDQNNKWMAVNLSAPPFRYSPGIEPGWVLIKANSGPLSISNCP
jgi:hypothetical protein